jgi:hypothetical protein
MNSSVAWQNWQLDLPQRWSPVRLEGDYAQGLALFSDLHRPRLGLRWVRHPRKIAPADFLTQLMRQEVGAVASLEAKPHRLNGWDASLLYLEPEPPGRDVWIAHHALSDRTLILVYHVHRRERLLAQNILPTLRDLPIDQPTPWSIFELSCIMDAGMALDGHRLNAGDLRLDFAVPRRRPARRLTLRQIAVAQLALQRMPLENWLAQQQRALGRHYRAIGPTTSVELDCHDRTLRGLACPSRRRRRFFFMGLPPQWMTYALHDAARDRLVFVQSTHDDLARRVLATIGWATEDDNVTR